MLPAHQVHGVLDLTVYDLHNSTGVFFSYEDVVMPINAMLVGNFKPSATFSTVRLSSFTVGPKTENGALECAPKDKLIIGCGISEKISRRVNTKKEKVSLYFCMPVIK